MLRGLDAMEPPLIPPLLSEFPRDSIIRAASFNSLDYSSFVFLLATALCDSPIKYLNIYTQLNFPGVEA